MENGIGQMVKIIDAIEADITHNPDCNALAAQMALSIYEFRRIFAFTVGCPISEYMRKRRLSKAACELMQNPNCNIQAVGNRYGYGSLSAFSKAFSEQHGCSPSACQKGNCHVRLFAKPQITFCIQNSSEFDVELITDTAFSVQGYCGFSEFTDTCCCENVWNAFYENGEDRKITAFKIYVAYQNERNCVLCTIGQRCSGIGDVAIPACRWLSVKMQTTDDIAVNQKYSEVLYRILPSLHLQKKAGIPTLEIFPFDMTEPHFSWEIRIPIEEGETL